MKKSHLLIIIGVFAFLIVGPVFIIVQKYSSFEAMVMSVLYYIAVLQTINFLYFKDVSKRKKQ